MQLAKFRARSGQTTVGAVEANQIRPLKSDDSAPDLLTRILEATDPAALARSLIDPSAAPLPLDQVALLAPLDRQEVWAAGVTYTRSKTARMEESATAANLYDRVYASPRPELFLKATPHRVVGLGEPVRIRRDSRWNVPEPELALVLNSRLQCVGYTIGNDMSSRDIEGENPLYLPQAKIYDACCSLGPWITLAPDMPAPAQIGIRLTVRRGREIAFLGATHVGQMARSFDELIGWLGRELSFPQGAILLTGTGVVPESDFTLLPDDVVEIEIDGIGRLSNPVVQGPLK